MSLTLLVVMVVAGITAIVVAVHLTGGTRTAALEDAEAARRRFADDFAEIPVRQAWLTEDRRTAFMALEDGRIGLVAALGDRFLTRIVGSADRAGQPAVDGRTVKLRLDDFTWRGGSFTFRSEEEARAVAALFADPRQRAQGAEAHG